jgi:tetratricopeptide (TPR) repeat protein
MAAMATSDVSLFYIYAPEDQRFCEALDKHLATMKRSGWIRTWHHRSIEAGLIWEQEIKEQLASADIILLLVSADLLASDECYTNELHSALQRHEAGEAVLVPVIVRSVDWSLTPFHMLQALPTEGKAVVNWANRDQAFFDIAQGLKRVIERRRRGQAPALDRSISYESLWTVPYRQNHFFTGRDDLLEQLSTYFSSWKAVNTPIAALYGLGGMGKTQIALEYAYRFSERYQGVFWVNASAQEVFLADVVVIADALGLPVPVGQEAVATLSQVKQWLSRHSRWLLIFDAVGDLSLATTIIPLRSYGHVIMTTRTPVSRTYAYTLEVEKLSSQAALDLLLRRVGISLEEHSLPPLVAEERDGAHRICDLLDGLPLALDQAGAYIEETGCSLTEYYYRCQQQHLMLLSLRGDSAAVHPDSVVTTWSLSFARLELQDPGAADLLRVCAFLAPAVIPQQIIVRGAAYLGPHLTDLPTNVAHFDAAIKLLRQFAFVRRFPQAQTISLHRLVQVIVRAWMEPEEQALWAERTVQALCATFPGKDDLEWSRCSFYIPHVYACERLIEDYHLEHIAVGPLFYRAGRFFHDHAQYEQAEPLYQQALRLIEASSEPSAAGGSVEVLDALGWLALDRGLFTQAEPFFQRAYALKKQVYGDAHMEIAITLHALGRLAQAQYRYEEAERLYLQALTIKEAAVGRESAEAATTLHALGWLCQDRGQYDAAFAYYQQAFAIRSKVLEPDHVSMATALHQLARMAHYQKHYEQAEKLYLQSLAIKEKKLGLEHPFSAIGMDALAWLYQDQGRFEEAEAYYQSALSIREQAFGQEHHFTAETMHHLGCLYQDQRLFQQAEALLLQASGIRERVLGPTHPLTAISTHQLARLYSTQQRWEEAEGQYQRTLAIRKQSFGMSHPATHSVIKGYARFLRSLQREREALELEQQLRDPTQ